VTVSGALAAACLVPVIGGTVYFVLSMLAVVWYRLRRRPAPGAPSTWPGVTLIKPVCGLERDLENRLRTACLQDYPDYQVIMTVQNARDPSIPILRRLEAEFGPDRLTVVVHQVDVGPNGKVNNLLGALPLARHDIVIISDSDVTLRPDYLRAMLRPFEEPGVGGVTSLFRTVGARRWFERLELLTLNADFIPSVVFAEVTGASDFCLGPSIAVRRSALERIGGLESLVEYLAEDYEIGHRIGKAGLRMVLVPYTVDIVLDLADWRQWWAHQIYWDHNTRVARPAGYFATILIRAVPFALLFAVARFGDAVGLGVLAATVAVRLVTAWVTLRFGLEDREGVRALAWLPVRDVVALAVWVLAFGQRRTQWRGTTYVVRNDGRMVAVAPPP
jgi:ceramide glucosyltransferase